MKWNDELKTFANGYVEVGVNGMHMYHGYLKAVSKESIKLIDSPLNALDSWSINIPLAKIDYIKRIMWKGEKKDGRRKHRTVQERFDVL